MPSRKMTGRRLARQMQRATTQQLLGWNEPVGECVFRQLGRGVKIKLFHQLGFMVLNRFGRDSERGGDFFHRKSFRHQLQDLPLTSRQPIGLDDRLMRPIQGRMDQVFGDEGGHVVISLHHGFNCLHKLRTGRTFE